MAPPPKTSIITRTLTLILTLYDQNHYFKGLQYSKQNNLVGAHLVAGASPCNLGGGTAGTCGGRN